jgi:hypothetical protein
MISSYLTENDTSNNRKENHIDGLFEGPINLATVSDRSSQQLCFLVHAIDALDKINQL